MENRLQLNTIATVPKIIKEASGLEISSSGLLWTHNDDRLPILYGLDSSGNILRTVHLNHNNNGWEDLTSDHQGNFYIGAFGNNKNDRKNLEILKLPDPETVVDDVINAGVIKFFYSDQQQFPPPDTHKNFDADAFISLRDSLFIFTKNRTRPFNGYTKVYRLPDTPGNFEAVLYDSIPLGEGEMMDHWVTSADISPDGMWLALLSHDCIWLLSDFHNRRFSKGTIRKIGLGNFSHKTGLCFASNTKLYIIDELELGFLGGKIYSLDIADILGNESRESDRSRSEK